MRRLIVMRHAKSSWNHPGLSDFERPLNTRGVQSAAALGTWLRAQGHAPDTAIVSAATRTVETFQGLALETPARITRDLYHASAQMLAEALKTETAQTILIVAHNPGIADFAERAAALAPDHDRFCDYPTGATLVVDFDAADWNGPIWGGGKVVDFIVPRDL